MPLDHISLRPISLFPFMYTERPYIQSLYQTVFAAKFPYTDLFNHSLISTNYTAMLIHHTHLTFPPTSCTPTSKRIFLASTVQIRQNLGGLSDATHVRTVHRAAVQHTHGLAGIANVRTHYVVHAAARIFVAAAGT